MLDTSWPPTPLRWPEAPLGDGVATLDRLTAGDVEAVAAACTDPEIQRWLPVPSPYTLADAEEFVGSLEDEASRGGRLTLAVRAAGRPELAGAITLRFDLPNPPGVAALGYWTVPEWRGRGLMWRAVRLAARHASTITRLRRIEILTHPDNLASRRVAERAGALYEGVRRHGLLLSSRGEVSDAAVYALLPDEVAPATDPDGVDSAQGVKVHWEQLPAVVRVAVEGIIGERVVWTETQRGGFTPGVSTRVRGAGGTRAFVKAVSAETNLGSADMHRREARVAHALPEHPGLPRLRASLEVGDWVVLVFDDIGGRTPTLPWRERELARVLDALAALSADLDPSPVPLPRIAEAWATYFRGWRSFAADPERLDAAGAGWARPRLHELAERESHWSVAADGTALVHGDLRADQLILSNDRVVVVDWPHAGVGASWVDGVLMFPSITMQQGPDPETLVRRYPPTAAADPEALTTVVTALAGSFLWHAAQPPPPGLPTVRAFQRAQGQIAGSWLRERLGETVAQR